MDVNSLGRPFGKQSQGEAEAVFWLCKFGGRKDGEHRPSHPSPSPTVGTNLPAKTWVRVSTF